jgi:serine/threonine protein kinase
MALAGAVLDGRYVLEQRIGSGGYGEVWHATDTVLSRPVAVKLLHPRYAQRSEALARFQAEARHAAALSQQNIARVYDYHKPAGDRPPYLVMELVNGPSLEAVLAGGPLDASQTMHIIAQAASGLRAAHAVGLIHRDVKPANLLLAPGGIVKVTDFGIAHTVGEEPVTATGELIGTPGYLAPERLTGEQVTSASDLYALGIVAYECLAGAPPFTGTALEVALAHRDRPLPPLPPSVAADVGAFVMQLTAKDPAWRPDSAADVAVWAGRLRDGLTVGPRNGPNPGSVLASSQRLNAARLRRPMVLACASIAIAVVIGLVLASVIGFAAPHPAAGPGPSGHSPGTGVVAQPAARPSTSPGRPPAGSPAAQPEAAQPEVAQPEAAQPEAVSNAAFAPVVAITSRSHEQGHGHGRAAGKVNGQGHGKHKH